MRLIVRAVALAAALSISFAGAAFAQDQKAAGGRRGGDQARGVGARGGAGLAMLRGLNLTDAQRQQIRTLTEQHREQNRAAEERLRSAMAAQRKAAAAAAAAKTGGAK